MLPTIAPLTDLTLIAPAASPADIDALTDQAIARRAAAVCVAPIYVARARKRLLNSGIRVCAATNFPFGTSKPVIKAIEASNAVKDGADEVEVVASLPHLLVGDVDTARAEVAEIVRAVRAARRDVTVKVAVETAALLSAGTAKGEQLIRLACQAVREGGSDYIVAGTGFHPAGGAGVEVVRLTKRYAENISVKAFANLQDEAAATAFIEAGANRIGMAAL